jgi:hypothetical protein
MLAGITAFVALCFALAAWLRAGEAMRTAEDALFIASLDKDAAAHLEMTAWGPSDER